MPTETIIVIIGLVLAFGAFMVALAWAEVRTRHPNTPSSPAE